MNCNWSYDQPQTLLQSANYYLQTLLDCNIDASETFSIPSGIFVPPGWSSSCYGSSEEKTEESIISSLVEGVLGFKGLESCLFHQSQSWVLDDLSGRGLWYVAVLAYVDHDFRKALQAYPRSF